MVTLVVSSVEFVLILFILLFERFKFACPGNHPGDQYCINYVDDAVRTNDVRLNYIGIIYHDTAIGKIDSKILSRNDAILH